ncbi:hypothetical protein [Frigoriglobus tundricola]|uniref:Uncharacterized protein n=1 Tax=Frigoriglobus tundricola TaxID=2774151 RepID=A0A6M5Z2S0_9BACT|nr:hypothetical protein [Frigoriglobus tundricola]QJX00539.1 hypothetical protein FTUN_8169 [Frigoriglobus tundricola]
MMSTPSRTELDEDAPGRARRAERLATVISASVLHELGTPADLFRVSVVRLWENHYRVNVQTGPDAVSTRVAHSFFLKVDEAGAVQAASPAIVRLY